MSQPNVKILSLFRILATITFVGLIIAMLLSSTIIEDMGQGDYITSTLPVIIICNAVWIVYLSKKLNARLNIKPLLILFLGLLVLLFFIPQIFGLTF